MARPTKQSLDYFPLDCHWSSKVKYVEAKHGFTGFAILIKLWAIIYSAEGYYCEWNEKTMFVFCRENSIDRQEFLNIMDTLYEEKLFDKTKCQKYGILTSVGVQTRFLKIIKDARRKNQKFDPKYKLI